MPTQTTTIALVHGAFAESASWNPVIEHLAQDAPALDIVAIANPLRGLDEDATYVGDVLRAIDGPVVLVAHSYGGMVATQAAARSDGVAALVFVAAFAPDHGESAFELSTKFPGSTLGDALTAHPVATGGDEVAIRPELFHHQFAADLPAAQAALMAATQRPVTLAALSQGLSAEEPAWKRIPSWFVYGAEDRNIPAALERYMADRAGAQQARELPGASHALSLSRPDAVAATILDAVAGSMVAVALRGGDHARAI